ncbi:MAG: hypothetical protein GKR94_24850 [Gammaproteobacteria bacterium]|nr:hypothetical protein [Gammaproteobacteria bacterium]
MPKRGWLFRPNAAIDGRRDHFGAPGTWLIDGEEALRETMDDATRIVPREQEPCGHRPRE